MSDVIDGLYAEIEKARRDMSPRARRDIARMHRKFAGGKLTNPSSALDRRISRRKPGHIVRNGAMLKKSDADFDVLDSLDDAIEKAKGLIPKGGSSAMRRKLLSAEGKAFQSVVRGKGSKLNYLRARGAGKYLSDRRNGGKVAAGNKGKRYEGYYEARRGSYK